MALEELVIVNPVGSKRRTTTKRKVKNMARRKVSRRSTTARRKAPARRTTRRKTTTRRRKAPARRKTTKRKATSKRRKTTTRRRKAPARRKTTRRKTTTRRRKAPARRKTTRRRRKSPARRKTTRRRKTPSRRRTASRRTVSRRRTTRSKMTGFFSKGLNWTRSHIMKFETMVALGSGLYLSASLPAYVEAALSKVGLDIGLTATPMRSAVSSIAVAGFAGYAMKQFLNVSNATAGAFTIAAMLPAALQLGRAAGLNFLPSISVSGGGLTAVNGIAGFGLLGNAPSVIEEPMFGMTHGYHDGMHAGAHGEMFGLGGKDINLF